MTPCLPRALIDLEAIVDNVAALKAKCDDASLFMAVVKADGYGHGAVKVAQTALKAGADWLGVARFHEAVQLRNTGIDAPILIFGYVFKDQVKSLFDLDLTPTVYDLDMAKSFSDAAIDLNRKLTVHLKVDTGMGRVGLLWEKAAGDTEQIDALKGITIGGVYTHFAAADSKTDRGQTYTQTQIDRFNQVLSRLDSAGIGYGIPHAANSAGIIAYKNSHMGMVRAGISLYGLYPSGDITGSNITLKPAMSLQSRIASVRTVPKGFSISYGMTYQTPKKTQIASVPIGYADGYSRRLSSRGYMLVNGQKAPICGRVCMDQTLIDVGHIEGVKPEDEVVLIGSQGKETIHADDLAQMTGTINYEVVSSLTTRVERVYPAPSRR